MKMSHNKDPLFPEGLLIIETTAQGRDKVWTANNLQQAIVVCLESNTRKGDLYDEFSAVDSLEAFKKVLSQDLRKLDVLTFEDFKTWSIQDLSNDVREAADSLDWIKYEQDRE
jgi:hypothetical protein